MRDALGGIVNIQMILIFIAVVSGYLAFSVNYTKAFRVKDYIINKLEEYETHTHNNANQEMSAYADKVGYSGPTGGVATNVCDYQDGSAGKVSGKNVAQDPQNRFAICMYEGAPTSKKDKEGNCYKRVYYRVVTFINIDIPVINKIMAGMSFFRIEGESNLIQTKEIVSCED